jgi:hypothetical protein
MMETSIIIAPARPDRKAPAIDSEMKIIGKADTRKDTILGAIRYAINPTANPRRENPVTIAILPKCYTYECTIKSSI